MQTNNELDFLSYAYGALVPISVLSWPSSTPLSILQEYLLTHLLFSDHFQSYPPSSTYQRAFWKWAIAQLESSDQEVDERIYIHYMSLLPELAREPTALPRPPAPSYFTHLWTNDQAAILGSPDEPETFPRSALRYRSTTLLVSRTTIESGTTGLRSWLAGFVLAEYFLQHPEFVRGRRVLELGSGAGFLGIIVANLQLHSKGLRGDTSLWLTDVNEQVLVRCKNNVSLPCNETQCHPHLNFCLLDWTASLDSRRSTLSSLLYRIDPDVIIGSDLVYGIEIIPALVAVLHLTLGHRSEDASKQREAHIALSARNESTIAEFVKMAEQVLDVREVTLDLVKPNMLAGASVIEENSLERRHEIKLFVITNKRVQIQ